MSRTRDRVIALAALFQAVEGVQHLARRGQADPELVQTAVRSILTRDADSTAEIFGGTEALQKGFRLLHRLLTQRVPDEDMILTRYAVGILHLARKLRRKPELMEVLTKGIDNAERSVQHFGIDHENVFATLADTYSNSAGQIHPRIMVSGDDNHLQNPKTVNMIRTLLLAGIRAGVAWYQLGGNRLGLIFRRKALADEALRLTHESSVA